MEWIPTPWQENLLWHFIRTGDYWCGPVTRYDGWTEHGPAVLIVGGNREDLLKLDSIAYILGGKVRRNYDERGKPWDYLWYANEHTERYLRWFEDKWENRGILDSPPRRRWVKECLEAIDEDRAIRQSKSQRT